MDSTVNDTQKSTIFQSIPDLVLGALTYVVVIVVIICGNSLVLLAIFDYRPLKKVQNYLVVSLASTDLAVATLVMPLHVVKFMSNGRWLLGANVCLLWTTLDIMCCTASILNLCAIAIDRYWAIKNPIEYAPKRTIKLVLSMVVCVWLISVFISIPPLVGWNNWSGLNTLNERCQLTTEKWFVVFSAIGSFFLPLMFLIFVYVKIFIATRQRIRKNRGRIAIYEDKLSMMGIRDENEKGAKEIGYRLISAKQCSRSELAINSSRSLLQQKKRISVTREKKAVKTLTIIMGAFVLCWMPFFLIYIITPFCSICNIHPKVIEATIRFGYTNSAINPVIFSSQKHL